jgi:CRISPR-associated protein Csb2
MITVVLRFSPGRYRVPPWATAGALDAPPSPWRLLRALHTTWRTRVPELDTAVVYAVLTSLAVPPTWHVPACRSGEGATTLDSAAELTGVWPGQLTTDQHLTLTRLVAAMPYLGRAENRCSGRVDDNWVPRDHQIWRPLDVAETVGEGRVTSVLAPEVPLDPTVLVARPADALRSSLPIPLGARLITYQHRQEFVGSPNAIRLNIVGRRPPATETVAVTDLFRRAALARLGTLRGIQDRTRLGGREADSSVLRDQHAHTSYLPIIEDDEVAGIVAWTPAGLAADEVTALRSVTRLSTNQHSLRLRLTNSPPASIYIHAPAIVGPARTWISTSPYVPSRYAKKRDRPTFLQEDIERELRHRRLPPPTSIIIEERSCRAWRRHRPSVARTSPQGQPNRDAAFLRITFQDLVTGPLAIGHLSHFGLGLFAPEK